MDVLGESRFRRVVCSKRYCGFSIQARNGTCCRRATRTTKRCIGAFRLGAAMRFCVACQSAGIGASSQPLDYLKTSLMSGSGPKADFAVRVYFFSELPPFLAPCLSAMHFRTNSARFRFAMFCCLACVMHS